jgi:GTP-binding protein
LTSEKNFLQSSIDTQVKYAIDECDVILFVISNKDGIDANDIYITKQLKKYKQKNVVLVSNKSENPNMVFEKSIFSLG